MNPMNPRDAERLAVRVRTEAASKVKVRLGRTNNRPCVHINDLDPRDPSRSSTTIYSEGEWGVHPLNRSNRPTKAAQARGASPDAAPGVLGSTAMDAVPGFVPDDPYGLLEVTDG